MPPTFHRLPPSCPRRPSSHAKLSHGFPHQPEEEPPSLASLPSPLTLTSLFPPCCSCNALDLSPPGAAVAPLPCEHAHVFHLLLKEVTLNLMGNPETYDTLCPNHHPIQSPGPARIGFGYMSRQTFDLRGNPTRSVASCRFCRCHLQQFLVPAFTASLGLQ